MGRIGAYVDDPYHLWQFVAWSGFSEILEEYAMRARLIYKLHKVKPARTVRERWRPGIQRVVSAFKRK